jgi:Asp-tRNA(Asn)/Glu-tRNA(Gln) amidotransferase A subunit family amidase
MSRISRIETATATELLRAYRARTISPVDVVETALRRIEQLDPDLNTFYEVHADAALRAARESEARWQAGCPLGLLDGVPTSTKDALLTKGSPTYRGSAANDADQKTWTVDAPCVARMKEHGAIILGRTTMPDFGMLASGASSKHGVTRNPWDLSRTPGGSSAGAAASIAAGINPIAVGTDIVGSIRLPASFCGLFGHKPSQGRVPYYYPSSPSMVAGPMARTVEDAALLMNVISLPDARDFTALPYDAADYLATLDENVPKARLGLLLKIGLGSEPDPEVLAIVERAAREFSRLGLEIHEVRTPFRAGDEKPVEDFYRVRCYTEFQQYAPERRRQAPVIERWTSRAAAMDAATLYRAYLTILQLRERTLHMMDDFDFLILPSVPVPAFAAELPGLDDERIFDPWVNTFLFNLTEQPAASIGCGFTTAGLPVGLQIVGRRFDDLGVFRLARAFERQRGDLRPWPIEQLGAA